MTVFSTALAHILFFRVLATAGAVTLSLGTFLIPVSAILLGFIVLGERLAPKQFVGMALIGLGQVYTDGRLFAGRHHGRASRPTGAVPRKITRIPQER